MDKPSIIPKWGYLKPSMGGHRGLKRFLKYVSYREDAQHRLLDLQERWTDCGLGGNWRAVYSRCVDLKGPYILAHNMVIAPAPDLMALLPEAIRFAVVREVTERTIDNWHLERGLPVAEYSYCLHDRDTSEHGLQNLHTHIFIAGTVPNELGERESHRVNREQVCTDRGGLQRPDNLHHIARREFETVLDRTLGRDWRREREQAQLSPDVGLEVER